MAVEKIARNVDACLAWHCLGPTKEHFNHGCHLLMARTLSKCDVHNLNVKKGSKRSGKSFGNILVTCRDNRPKGCLKMQALHSTLTRSVARWLILGVKENVPIDGFVISVAVSKGARARKKTGIPFFGGVSHVYLAGCSRERLNR